MEINEQLFEDVLSGKLKGTFVLRGGSTLNSKCLKRTKNTSIYNSLYYPYALVGNGNNNILYSFSYTENGIWNRLTVSSNDIVDFIPDTDMKENELTIEIPDNKVVDWDESKKQNKIVLKDKQLTYEGVCKKLFENKEIFYTEIDGTIDSGQYSEIKDYICDKNNALSKHQLECILAKNQLATVAKYLNDGWKPDKTAFGCFDSWVLFMTTDKDYIGCVKTTYCAYNSNSLFKSKELAQQAIEVLGEETVKLALEPLGI